MQCFVCYELKEPIQMLSICQDDRHQICHHCYELLQDKSICCFCRQINPNYHEPYSYQNSDSLENSSEFIISTSSGYLLNQHEDPEYEPWVLQQALNTELISTFTIHNDNRQEITYVIELLQQMLLNNFIQTRSVTRILNNQL